MPTPTPPLGTPPVTALRADTLLPPLPTPTPPVPDVPIPPPPPAVPNPKPTPAIFARLFPTVGVGPGPVAEDEASAPIGLLPNLVVPVPVPIAALVELRAVDDFE